MTDEDGRSNWARATASIYKYTHSDNVAPAYMILTKIYRVRRTRLLPDEMARTKADWEG